MNCPICDTAMTYKNKDYQGISFYYCDKCKIGASDPSEQEIYDESCYFNDWDGTYSEESLSNGELYLDIIEKYNKGRRLLDVGTGNACVPWLAKKRGFEAEGTDISSYTCKVVPEKTGIKMHHGFLEQLAFEDKYDVVSLIHVLEHTTNPQEYLEISKNLIVDDGIIFIVVPSYYTPSMYLKSLIAPVSSKPYKHLSCFHHNWFFSLKSLVSLGEKAGLKVLHQSTISHRRKNRLFHSVLQKFDLDNWVCAIFAK